MGIPKTQVPWVSEYKIYTLAQIVAWVFGKKVGWHPARIVLWNRAS